MDPVLRITSDPAGARVTVNGVGWGTTPVVIRHLPPGAKTIRVTKDGYIADQRVVSLSGASAVQLRLRRSPAQPAASTTDMRQRILGWILFGLIVGALAKLVMPGRDPGGIIITMLLGIAGAVIGGFVGRAMGFYGPNESAGFLMSFVGAVILLALYRMFVGRRTITRP